MASTATPNGPGFPGLLRMLWSSGRITWVQASASTGSPLLSFFAIDRECYVALLSLESICRICEIGTKEKKPGPSLNRVADLGKRDTSPAAR